MRQDNWLLRRRERRIRTAHSLRQQLTLAESAEWTLFHLLKNGAGEQEILHRVAEAQQRTAALRLPAEAVHLVLEDLVHSAETIAPPDDDSQSVDDRVAALRYRWPDDGSLRQALAEDAAQVEAVYFQSWLEQRGLVAEDMVTGRLVTMQGASVFRLRHGAGPPIPRRALLLVAGAATGAALGFLPRPTVDHALLLGDQFAAVGTGPRTWGIYLTSPKGYVGFDPAPAGSRPSRIIFAGLQHPTQPFSVFFGFLERQDDQQLRPVSWVGSGPPRFADTLWGPGPAGFPSLDPQAPAVLGQPDPTAPGKWPSLREPFLQVVASDPTHGSRHGIFCVVSARSDTWSVDAASAFVPLPPGITMPEPSCGWRAWTGVGVAPNEWYLSEPLTVDVEVLLSDHLELGIREPIEESIVGPLTYREIHGPLGGPITQVHLAPALGNRTKVSIGPVVARSALAPLTASGRTVN